VSASDGPAEIVEHVSGTGVPVRGNDVDTDQIIPARFLKVMTFDGLGQFAFFDQRFDEDDNPKDHPLNEEKYQEASILVVNANFGCGSSREHAPQALMRWGIDAVVGESFAEIFADNCLTLGIPTVTVDGETATKLQHWVEVHPDEDIQIDLTDETLQYDDESIEIGINDIQRKALTEGIWDTTALLGSNPEAGRETIERLPYT
jgi:3-isopropylmalate/(R)-2-methylmalate dehydratase small subunit